MENNWEEKILELLEEHPEPKDMDISDITKFTLEAMNLVFEATKKECAEAPVELFSVDKESILNINKPNL